MNRGLLPADIRDSSQLWSPSNFVVSHAVRLWPRGTAEYSPRLVLRFRTSGIMTSLRHVLEAMGRNDLHRLSFAVLSPYSPMFIR
jgi:hypothetical protein